MSATPPPGYRTQSEDTSYAAELVLFERWRGMSLDEKAALVASPRATCTRSAWPA